MMNIFLYAMGSDRYHPLIQTLPLRSLHQHERDQHDPEHRRDQLAELQTELLAMGSRPGHGVNFRQPRKDAMGI